MKVVVSNTSPIRYLRVIGEQDLLYKLFKQIFIPEAVFQELKNKNAPLPVRTFIEPSLEWIHIINIKKVSSISGSSVIIPETQIGDEIASSFRPSLLLSSFCLTTT